MAKTKEAPAEGGKTYEVRLKPGHPTGVYRRAGHTFHPTEPVTLTELPETVTNDRWLIVTEVPRENA